MKKKFSPFWILIILLVAFIIFNLEQIGEIRSTDVANSKLEVHFIDVGQGNAVLVRLDGKVMLIDGGDRQNSSKFISYLERQNIKHIDYMIASHYDSDHISGLIGAMQKYPIDYILNPGYVNDTQTYRNFIKHRDKSKSRVIVPHIHDEYKFSDAVIRIVGPTSYDFQEGNDNSIVVKLVYKNISFLFPGDAAKSSESTMIYTGENLRSDILMLGHHGSKYSSNDFFLDEVTPKLAIISCGKDNRYKHPADEVLKRLDQRKIPYLRTDQNGDIVITSDGKKFEIRKEK